MMRGGGFGQDGFNLYRRLAAFAGGIKSPESMLFDDFLFG